MGLAIGWYHAEMFCLGDDKYYLVMGDALQDGWHGGHMTLRINDTNTPLCVEQSVPIGMSTYVCNFELPFSPTISTILGLYGVTAGFLEAKQSSFLNSISSIIGTLLSIRT